MTKFSLGFHFNLNYFKKTAYLAAFDKKFQAKIYPILRIEISFVVSTRK